MKKRNTTPLICLFTLLITVPTFGWRETMHRNQLTLEALSLVKQANEGHRYSSEIWERYGTYILQGAHDEDWPTEPGLIMDFHPLAVLCRANNHYRHAISGTGLTCTPYVNTGDVDVDALTWALTNPYLKENEEFRGGEKWALKGVGLTPNDVERGNMSWKKAIERYGYTQDEKKLAYYTLGFILHLLQDMGCCEHVHDDPHAGSGFTGFEKFVETHWNKVKPNLATLKPRKLPDVLQYFDRLAKIGYSSNRFKGWDTRIDPRVHLVHTSDLGRMFLVNLNRRVVSEREQLCWCLRSAPNDACPEPVVYRWWPGLFKDNPRSHKAYEDGQFWPTCQEMIGVAGDPENDKPGYFYIELSDDLDAGDTWPGLSGLRHLYPMAYLPTPLPEVAGECTGWARPSLDGQTHLYEVIGRAVFPSVISYSAGLVRHYFDIVNSPPYVKEVTVFAGREISYEGLFEDQEVIKRGTDTIRTVRRRNLLRETDEACEPDDALIRVFFSEPVKEVKLRVGSQTVRAQPESDPGTWSALFRIPDRGPSVQTYQVEIEAKDYNAHYGNKGGTLDSDPRTPARRIISGRHCQWFGYQPGVDRNHRFTVHRSEVRDTGWFGRWAIKSLHQSGPAEGGRYDSVIEVVRTGSGNYVHWGNNKWKCSISGNTMRFTGKHPSGGVMYWNFVRKGNKLIPNQSTFRGKISGESAHGIYEGHKQ